MKKRILSLGLTVLMLCSMMSVSAFAANINDTEEVTERVFVNGVDVTINVDEEIARAINGITDINVSDMDAPLVVAVASTSDNSMPVEVYSTTRKINLPISSTAVATNQSNSVNAESTIYATTSVALLAATGEEKSDDNSENERYVTAYGTIYWRDNFGMGNDFLGASGGWKRDINPNTNQYPTLSSEKSILLVGQTDARDRVHEWFYTTGMSFYISEDDFDYTRHLFWFDSTVEIDGEYDFTLNVSTSMFTS